MFVYRSCKTCFQVDYRVSECVSSEFAVGVFVDSVGVMPAMYYS